MSKSFIFLVKSFSVNCYRHLATFYWSHWIWWTVGNLNCRSLCHSPQSRITLLVWNKEIWLNDTNYTWSLLTHNLFKNSLATIKSEECHLSSVDISAPSILPPRVWVPSTPYMAYLLLSKVSCVSQSNEIIFLSQMTQLIREQNGACRLRVEQKCR